MYLRKDPDGFQSGQYERVEELLRLAEKKPLNTLFRNS